MNIDNLTSNLLFGVFFLREQLHTYVDILEIHHHHISKHVGYKTVASLLENKRLMLGLSENRLSTLMEERVKAIELFHPFKEIWLHKDVIYHSRSSVQIRGLLQEFDKFMMAWCYLFITDEHTDVDETGYLLTMIRYAKADIDLLII